MRDNQEQVCGRADELISLLYGELGEQDAREFNRHLQECAHCGAELAGFGQVRESLVSWRDESLGAAWSRVAANGHTLAARADHSSANRIPSAFAAIREFFNLSPVWMKGAAAFASLLFCVCAIVAIAHLREKSKPIVQTPSSESTAPLTAKIANLEDELAKARAAQTQNQNSNAALTNTSSPRKVTKQNQFVASAGTMKTRNLTKPLSRQERQELAADLGLLASRDDDDLDLVTDTINRAP
jgi:hypothetical protein